MIIAVEHGDGWVLRDAERFPSVEVFMTWLDYIHHCLYVVLVKMLA